MPIQPIPDIQFGRAVLRIALGILIVLAMGCSNDRPRPVASTTPASTSTPDRIHNLEKTVLDEARTWKTPDDVWARVHSGCKEALSEKHKTRALKGISGLMAVSKDGPRVLDAHTATPSPSYTYPVSPTHVVLTTDGLPMYFIAVEGDEWHVVLTKPTEAGEKAQAEYNLSDDELKILVKKIADELTQEQRAQLVATLKSKGKIAAIKELRKMSAHSLKVQKMVVEQLQAESQK